ncbi:MAG TPA: PAS domain S-box protein [bacterium]|nr:PAS domain S-box protein [bacterium]HOM27548.1 PAS domain S-box protein [bacterium]
MNNINKINKRNLNNLILKIQKEISKNKFINILSNLLTEGISINYKGRIVYCNDKYAEIFGYKKEELIGENILKLCSTESKGEWEEILKRKKEGFFKTECIKKDGSKIFINVNIKNVELGRKILRVVTVIDVTEEQLYLQKIKESEEKYRILTETLLDGILVIDIKGNFLFANHIAINLLGFKSFEELRKRNFFDFIIEKEKFLNDLRMIEENKSGYFTEYEIIESTGSKLFIESIGRKINYSGIDAFLISFRDITERKVIIENLKRAIEKNKKILDQTVIALSEMLSQRDPYTSSHQKRVAKLAISIAKEIGFTGSLIEGMKIAGLLHDIGKIYIPADILSKPGELTDIEWQFIKLHPEFGAKIIKNIEFPWNIEKIVLQHHERINGSGYPNKIGGKEILIETKILSVADVVEAMTFHRPYREKKTIKEALEEIETNSGILFEPEVVNATLKVFNKGFDFEDC